MNYKHLQKLLESELVQPFVKHHDFTPSKYSNDDVDDMDINSGVNQWLDDTGDPHEVGLNSFKGVKFDEKAYFFLELSDLMGSNPYMPVVYNINQFVDDTGSKPLTRSEFKLERLIPFRKIPLLQLTIAIKNVLSELETVQTKEIVVFDKIIDMLYKSDPSEHIKTQVYTYYSTHFTKQMREAATIPDKSNGLLYEFNSRLYEFTQKYRKKHLHVDINPSNMMFRRTNHGVQLVINDPINAF